MASIKKLNRRSALKGFASATSVSAIDAFVGETLITSQSDGPDDYFVALPPGRYRSTQFQVHGKRLSIVATIPGTVTIEIAQGRFFLELDGFVERLIIDGITFSGGAGAIKLTRRQQNVAHGLNITRCDFIDYTECAIQNESSDHPYLRVSYCRFECALSARGVGIAWRGNADCTVIEKNAFLRNVVHLKIGPRLSGNIQIQLNDFILTAAVERQADIWIVPNVDAGGFGANSGYATMIKSNKFGNENLRSDMPRILIAHEDSSCRRLAAQQSVLRGFVHGITIADNRISGVSGASAPIIDCRIENLNFFTWSNNKIDGGKYKYVVKMPPINPLHLNKLKWNVQLSAADGPSIPTLGFTNFKNYPWLST